MSEFELTLPQTPSDPHELTQTCSISASFERVWTRLGEFARVTNSMGVSEIVCPSVPECGRVQGSTQTGPNSPKISQTLAHTHKIHKTHTKHKAVAALPGFGVAKDKKQKANKLQRQPFCLTLDLATRNCTGGGSGAEHL